MPILAVEDVDKSLKFYTEGLGFAKMFDMPGEDGAITFAGVGLGQAAFGLNKQGEIPNKGSGVAFMVYVPEDQDLDAYYAQVQANGIAIAQEIKDEYWGDRTFGVADPDGYFLILSKTVKQLSFDEIAAAGQAQ